MEPRNPIQAEARHSTFSPSQDRKASFFKTEDRRLDWNGTKNDRKNFLRFMIMIATENRFWKRKFLG